MDHGDEISADGGADEISADGGAGNGSVDSGADEISADGGTGNSSADSGADEISADGGAAGAAPTTGRPSGHKGGAGTKNGLPLPGLLLLMLGASKMGTTGTAAREGSTNIHTMYLAAQNT